jgi:hypothetical protein
VRRAAKALNGGSPVRSRPRRNCDPLPPAGWYYEIATRSLQCPGTYAIMHDVRIGCVIAARPRFIKYLLLHRHHRDCVAPVA